MSKQCIIIKNSMIPLLGSLQCQGDLFVLSYVVVIFETLPGVDMALTLGQCELTGLSVQGFQSNPSDPTRFFQPQDNGNKVITRHDCDV